MSILRTQNLKFSYENNKIILDDINVEFEQGRIYAILGSSGCGKTTFLSLLGGLDRPSDGKILYHGKSLDEIGYETYRHDHICFVFQNYNLVEYMTAAENVRLIVDQNPASILNKVGLSADEQKRNVLKLSGGQQQRVAIARALASPAKIILADEPTGSLDEETSVEIMKLFIDQVREFEKCAIIVTHSPVVAQMADTIFQISRGHIEYCDV